MKENIEYLEDSKYRRDRLISRDTGNLDGPKTPIFGFLHDKFHYRENGWMVKFLTKRGIEVLTKSVENVLPNHVMSCFRLPKSVTTTLTSVVSQFWWKWKRYALAILG